MDYRISIFTDKRTPEYEVKVSGQNSYPMLSPYNDSISILHDEGISYFRWSNISSILIEEIK